MRTFPALLLLVAVGCSDPGRDRVERARKDLAEIDKALQAYHARHGSYPAAIEALCAPDPAGGPVLELKYLTDPWGQAYRYEPPNPQAGRPRVWSVGPPGGEKVANQ